MAVPRLQFSRLYFRAADTRIQECGGEAEGPISSAGRNSHSSNASGRQSTMGVVRRFMMPFSKTTVSSDLSLTGVVPDDGADADSRSSTALRRRYSSPSACCPQPSTMASLGSLMEMPEAMATSPEEADDGVVRRSKSRPRISVAAPGGLPLPGVPADSPWATGHASIDSDWSAATGSSFWSPIRTCSGCLSPASSIAGADSGGRADDDSAEDAEPLKRLAARCGWCLLRAPCSQPVQRTPSSTRATVVHLPLEQMGELRRAVSEAMAHAPRGKPVIVLLDTAGGPSPDERAVEDLTMSLVERGADGVVFRAADDEQTCWAIRLSIAEAVARARLREREAKNREMVSRRRAAERIIEPSDGMFWNSAHHLFKGLPRLDVALPSDLCTGAIVGPCELRDVLGRGQFGCVYSAHPEEGDLEAVKILDKGTLTSLRLVKNMWMEMCCLRRLSHPNVVAFRGLLHSPNHMLIRMEHAGSNNLFRELKVAGGQLALGDACGLQVELLAGLEHCHDRGVAHRDIKPENIAICDGHIKIVDFGSAAPTDKLTDDLVGTMPLIAPEVLRAPVYGPYMPAPADIWSSAIVFVEMACGTNHLSRWVCWPGSPKAEPEAAGPLVRFFSDPQRVRDALVESLPSAGEGLVECLSQCVRLDAESRLSSKQAHASMQAVIQSAQKN